MNIMRKIRKKAKTEEIDYLFLMDCLSSYKQPRDKLTTLLKNHQLIRVKKGLYIFGKEYQQRLYSLEVLANLIYGPSYISFEYALAYYNLIPETVLRVTSACAKRIKHFRTPVGEFMYYYVSLQKFPSGITWKSIDEHTHFLIATKEKALADYLARIKTFANQEDLLLYLIEGMRIESKNLFSLKSSLVDEIAYAYQNKNVTLLCDILKK
ncbi:MAG: hypothetical protein K1000chlam2_01688 [Chlamydiae bacterium]|nr:hypothetical protein [Chlamydiota bacterium]